MSLYRGVAWGCFIEIIIVAVGIAAVYGAVWALKNGGML